MGTTLNKSATNAARPAISHEVVEWIKSTAGQTAVNSAVENSLRAVNRLSEARKIQPDQLHVPITL